MKNLLTLTKKRFGLFLKEIIYFIKSLFIGIAILIPICSICLSIAAKLNSIFGLDTKTTFVFIAFLPIIISLNYFLNIKNKKNF